MPVNRRKFLKAMGAGAGLSASGVTLAPLRARTSAASRQPRSSQGSPDFLIVGAGTFGLWTALNLRRQGASVTVIDAHGPGNSRSTSGGETRGVRSSYGDRRHGLQWTGWAKETIRRWQQWDEENSDRLLPRVFFQTGDLILREEVEPYIEDTRANWDAIDTPYEVLGPDEVRKRWPHIRFENLGVALYEPDAGVVRARRAIESVARVFTDEGGNIVTGRIAFEEGGSGELSELVTTTGERLSAGTFVFACGPWFPKVFPKLMGRRLRIPMGHVFYFAIPDDRFAFPNMPSYGVPGCTGWPALGPDHRGFRVRTGGRPGEDPDLSDRWIDKEFHERPREILSKHFPDLVGAPINETRACHYESSVDSNFIVDTHPDHPNVWLTGGGSAEAFKFGPVLGEYIAQRLLGTQNDPALERAFRLKEKEFEDKEAKDDSKDDNKDDNKDEGESSGA